MPRRARVESESSSEDEQGEAAGGFSLFKKRDATNESKGDGPSKPDTDVEQLASSDEDEAADNAGHPVDDSDWTFESLGLSPWLVDNCAKLGMAEPTLVQKRCVPPTLRGCNIIGSAPTGSGKTAAFALPILDKLAADMYGVFAVVLTPTRELAFQIAEQFLALGAPIRVRCEIIVGGSSLVEQQDALAKRPHVVVGTPGRLSAHLRGPTPPKLRHAAFVVLDEADRLLEPTFASDLACLFKATPPSRQTLLYSATMTSALGKAKQQSKKQLFEFHANKLAATPGLLDERYLLVPHQVKPVYLAYVLRRLGPEVAEGPLAPGAQLGAKKRRRQIAGPASDRASARGEEGDARTAGRGASSAANEGDEDSSSLPPFHFERAKLAIVFTSSCRNCQLIGQALLELGVNCSVLHGGLTQNRRLAALGKFRSRITNVLVATDVASRGLDIPFVDMVVNYDVPHSVEDYVHRVGRTARAGRSGLAVTFVSQYDIKLVHAIEATTGSKLHLLPDVHEEADVLVLLTRVSNAVQAARLAIADDEERHQFVASKRKRR